MYVKIFRRDKKICQNIIISHKGQEIVENLAHTEDVNSFKLWAEKFQFISFKIMFEKSEKCLCFLHMSMIEVSLPTIPQPAMSVGQEMKLNAYYEWLLCQFCIKGKENVFDWL